MTPEQTDKVRVRFAPSPTGYLHIGGARTAIFNWFFARHHKGKFLLRIEDTDFARSDPKMVQVIYDSLKWLGLDWDEKPVFQSTRLEKYRQIAQQLIENNQAYYCYCSQEKLAERRKKLDEKDEHAYRYDGQCRHLDEEKRKKLEAGGMSKVVRLKMEPGKTVYQDVIHGSLIIDNNEIDDFIIMRRDGIPTYNFAVVVDDHDMRISHVIRGDDHLSNTPKQLMLYSVLDWQPPNFAHVPLILGPDKKRLSKRHGAKSISEYDATGFLPEAILNFLSLLGWSSGENREIMTRQQLIESFNLKGISKKSAVFDETKLIWMNGQYINQMSDDEILNKILPILAERNLVKDGEIDKIYIRRVISLLKQKIKKISDIANLGYYFFKDPEQYDEKAIKKYWHEESVNKRLKAANDRLSGLNEFVAKNIESVIRNLGEEIGISAAELIHPIRLALTGFGVSPGLFELMELLGKETVLRRIINAINWITE